MFGKEVWKYFLYFLLFSLLVFFVYVIYKLSVSPTKEGFQSSSITYILSNNYRFSQNRSTPPFSNEIRISELTSWTLSMPPEFETRRTVWNTTRPHLYVGTLSKTQQDAIAAAEIFYNNWALAIRKYGSSWNRFGGTFYPDELYVFDVNRFRIVDKGKTLQRAIGNPIASWSNITIQDVRKLNTNLADTVVQYMYDTQLQTIKDIEIGAFIDADKNTGYDALDFGQGAKNRRNRIANRAADSIRNNLHPSLIDNKTKNNWTLTYITLDATNSDAARAYLAQNPQVQEYLQQIGVFFQWTAIGELAGPALGIAMKVLNALKGQSVRAAYALQYVGRSLVRLQGGVLRNYLARSGSAGLRAGLRAIRGAATLLRTGKLGVRVASSLGKALRAAKAAIQATNPLGAVMMLVDAILSLVPDKEWERLGREEANKQIASQMLKCPIGFIDASNLELDTFETILDILPIPSGFGVKEKAMSRQLSCVNFDSDGQPIIKDKSQCAIDTGAGLKASQAVQGFKADWSNFETCFGDPDAPFQLYPIEPTPVTLESVEQVFTRISAPMKEEVDQAYFFPDNWGPFSSIKVFPTITTGYPAEFQLAKTEIYKGMREVLYTNPISEYNKENTQHMLDAKDIPVGFESQNYDFYFDDLIGDDAIHKFVRSSVDDRKKFSCFMAKTAYATKFLEEVRDIFQYSVYSMKMGFQFETDESAQDPSKYIRSFSPDDTKVYDIKTDILTHHTLFLDKYMKELTTYALEKLADVLRYGTLIKEYEEKTEAVAKELGDLRITALFLDSCAQYLYEETYKISSGNTVTFIDKVLGAVIVSDYFITLICNISCINKGKGPAPWRAGASDNNVGIEFYLDKIGGVWRPTAWGRPDPNSTNPSIAFTYTPRTMKLDYVPTISYKYTKYFNTNCSDPVTLRTQLNYYKENNPLMNIKAITGWKTENISTCVMSWTEIPYNPIENTETGFVRTNQARFFYQSPNTPYPYKDGKPIVDEYLGYASTTTQTGMTAVNLPQPNRGLPPETNLLGNCNRRCYDPVIMKSIMDRFNSDATINGGSEIVNIKKIFTSKNNRCDFIANVNTRKGVIEEQNRQAIVTLLSTPACSYRVDSIGSNGTGTFVSFTEGFQNSPIKEAFQDLNVTPYPGYFYQSTTVNSATVPKYNFGDNILGSVIGGIQNTWNSLTSAGTTTRLKTYATLGVDGNLEGCPNVKCSSDEVIRAIATKYNLDNWSKTRMNRVLKATTAGPLECDLYFEDLNISGSNRVVNFYRDGFSGRYASERREITRMDDVSKLTTTFFPAGSGYVNMSTVYYSMRFTMRKIPNTCQFEAVSSRFMQPDPSPADAEDTSKPIFTANTQTRTLSSPRNVSSMFGCGEVDICNDYNTNVMMTRLYQTQNPNNRPRTISRIYKSPNDLDKCTVEFLLDNRIGQYQPNAGANSNMMVRDTYVYTFVADSNTCRWRIQSAAPHPVDGLQFTRGSNFNSRGQNYVPGRAVSLDGLNIRDTLNFSLTNQNGTPITYRTPSCPTAPVLNPEAPATRNSAIQYYNLFTGQQITRIVDSAPVNSTTCEYKVETTAGTSFEATHIHFNFIPLSNCAGHQAIGFSNVGIANSLTEGWGRPENPACYPVDCTSSNIQTLSRSAINPFNLAESNVTFNRVARVNSNTCEFEITTPRISPLATYNSNAYRRVTFRSVGRTCDTQVTGTTVVTNQSDSLTFNMPFSCPSFNPMSMFTGTSATTNFNLLQGAIRQLYLSSRIFIDSTTTTNTFDMVNGPSIRSGSNGIIIDRARILSSNAPSGNQRAELDIRIRAYLSRPNSQTYPYTLALAKRGTLITQATNQVDWNNYDNQFPVTPGNTWGPRQPPSEFRPEGVYEFSQSNFTSWQPVLHPVLEFHFPTKNCSMGSITNTTTFAILGLTFVQSKEQSIFP